MKKKLLLLFQMLFISGILIFNSCSKSDNETTEQQTTQLSALKNKYAPYEIVMLTASENIFSSSSFNATINNQQVEINAQENNASFILPDLSNGSYELSFSLDNKNYTVAINVVAATNIAAPQEYMSQMQTDINSHIVNLNNQITILEQNSDTPSEYQSLKNDVVKYTNLLNEYTTAYNNLSDADKQEFAKVIAANQDLITEFNNLNSDLSASFTNLRTPNSVQDYEADVEASMGKFVFSVAYTVGHIPLILTGGKLLAASFNPGVLAALGVVTTSFLINVADTVTAAVTLTSKSIKPFEFITETSLVVYESGVEKITDIKARYRSLINNDADDPDNGSVITTIAGKYNNLKDNYNSFISNLPSFIRPSYVMQSLKNSYKTIARSVSNSYITINNNNNPNVNLQQLNQPDGTINISATTDAETDQNFTYTVNYTNTKFTGSLTKTVNAKVTGTDICSQGIMTAPVITNVTVECNNESKIAILISFTANGTGVLVGDGFGSADPSSTEYPTRLYFLNPGAAEFSIAYNGYDVQLISGDVNSGVIEITLSGSGNCIDGQSAMQSLNSNYPNYIWKVELMNQCNQRSAQVTL
ncbi:hypothetical protein [Flavobacterium sp. AG291]|uniref:hypothetical protein n=1 Tax=Flavobacterium sp. AG291 TaxID=2184000 RepID=UPI000E0ADB1F|nr:hypothetical protein [Flavobacterium sp. AG291]RDI06927.1 hypothetical protein DEU42_11325 [Flavobacterium sp. AG291]